MGSLMVLELRKFASGVVGHRTSFGQSLAQTLRLFVTFWGAFRSFRLLGFGFIQWA